MRRSWLVGLVACSFIGTALPAMAVPASGRNKIVYEFTEADAQAEAAAASEGCGFEIDVELTGWTQTMTFDAGGGNRQQESITVFHGDATFTAGDRTYHIHDVGPDHYYSVDGVLYVALTGRSLTGSGVIGHVIINLDTGEVEFQAGNDQGFYGAAVCAALS